MKKRILPLLSALILGTAAFGACGGLGDRICDECGIDGQEITAEAWQEAKLSQDDGSLDALMEKVVLRYEKNVELCKKCAAPKYGNLPIWLLTDPAIDESVVEAQIKSWEEYTGKKLDLATESFRERYPFFFENN